MLILDCYTYFRCFIESQLEFLRDLRTCSRPILLQLICGRSRKGTASTFVDLGALALFSAITH